MLWKQKSLNYSLKSPFVYLNLIGLTKTEDDDINFRLITFSARIHPVVMEISNCDTWELQTVMCWMGGGGMNKPVLQFWIYVRRLKLTSVITRMRRREKDNEWEREKETKMVGKKRGPFGGQCTNCGFRGCRKTWSLVCINIELRIWRVEGFSKKVINHLQNRCVCVCVCVCVCHKRCHCRSRYWILWKGSVDHKTLSSKLGDFSQFTRNIVLFSQIFSSALYFPAPSILPFPQKLVQSL